MSQLQSSLGMLTSNSPLTRGEAECRTYPGISRTVPVRPRSGGWTSWSRRSRTAAPAPESGTWCGSNTTLKEPEAGWLPENTSGSWSNACYFQFAARSVGTSNGCAICAAAFIPLIASTATFAFSSRLQLAPSARRVALSYSRHVFPPASMPPLSFTSCPENGVHDNSSAGTATPNPCKIA